jgi:hypothetical protein
MATAVFAPPPAAEATVLQRSPDPIIRAPIAPSPAAIPTQTIPPDPPKQFVDPHVTPDCLVGLYDGNTALRAETLISEQIGKWMSVSGPLGEIHPGSIMLTSGRRTRSLAVFAYGTKPTVYMWFSDEWFHRLALLPQNQNISVVGKIKNVTGYNSKVELENCELVDPDPVADSPTKSPTATTRPRRRSAKTSKLP